MMNDRIANAIENVYDDLETLESVIRQTESKTTVDEKCRYAVNSYLNDMYSYLTYEKDYNKRLDKIKELNAVIKFCEYYIFKGNTHINVSIFTDGTIADYEVKKEEMIDDEY